MKQVVLITSILFSGLAFVGCQPESTAYQYRAGSLYEYNRLMDSWIPNNDTLPPLPPVTAGSQGRWIEVPAPSKESEPLLTHRSEPQVYIGAYYGWDRPYRSWRHARSCWHPGRYRPGSGFSIGLSFGPALHRSAWGRYGYWDTWNRDWPHTGACVPRHFRW